MSDSFLMQDKLMKQKFTWKQTFELLWWRNKLSFFKLYCAMVATFKLGLSLDFYASFPYIGPYLEYRIPGYLGFMYFLQITP